MPATIAGSHLGADTHANRPAANAAGQPVGALYSCTTHSLVYKTDGSTWSTWASLAGTGLADPMTTRGDVIYRNASNVSARLALGAAGKVPTSDGTDLAYAYPGLVLLEQHTASSSAALDFTTGITSAFDEYEFHLVGVLPASDAAALQAQVSTDGGSTWQNSNYFGRTLYYYSGGTGITGSATGSYLLEDAVSNASTGGINGRLSLFAPGSTAKHKRVISDMVHYHTNTEPVGYKYIGEWKSTTAVNALRFAFGSGNIASGVIRMYGVAK